MTRLGVFGGTFDPPHIAHLILAAEAHFQLGLDRLLWVLTPSPPHKSDRQITSVTDRLPMVQSAIDGNPDLTVIDVSPDYAKGHLPGAVNYYLGDGSLDAAIPNLDKNAMYLVYCHFESASRAGAQKLEDAGFQNVYRLDGDYSAWVAFGYPIEK